jgi:hypothetical protein
MPAYSDLSKDCPSFGITIFMYSGTVATAAHDEINQLKKKIFNLKFN